MSVLESSLIKSKIHFNDQNRTYIQRTLFCKLILNRSSLAVSLRYSPVLLGSWDRCPPSEWCNLSVMPWILSTKLLRACACPSAPATPPVPPMPPPPPPPLHCGISSAMLLMFGMEPNYRRSGWEQGEMWAQGGPKRNVQRLFTCT